MAKAMAMRVLQHNHAVSTGGSWLQYRSQTIAAGHYVKPSHTRFAGKTLVQTREVGAVTVPLLESPLISRPVVASHVNPRVGVSTA